MESARVSGAARRRRERRLHSFWRHERMAIQMALSEANHHSASRGAWHESYKVPRGQMPDRAWESASTQYFKLDDVDRLADRGSRTGCCSTSWGIL